MIGGAWLSRRPVRVATALLLGALAGVYAASLLVIGWITAVTLAIWFAWRHRSPSRRQEIAWLGLGAIGAFTIIGPR